MIEVEGPDGSIAEFPDGTPPDVIKQAMRKHFPAPMGRMEDAGLSLASGVHKGAAYLAGAAGDVRDLGARAVGWGAEKLGASPETAGNLKTAARYISPFAMAPTSEQTLAGIDQAGINLHKPQYPMGEYAETFGEFLPGAFVGPGGWGARAAQAVIPAMASESAGQAARKVMPAAEPHARVVAALLSGRGPRAKRPAIPTSEELLASASDDFKRMGATVKPEAYDRMVTGIGAKAADEGVRPFLEPAATGVIREMDEQSRYINTIGDIHKVRRLAGRVAGKTDKDERWAGSLIKREIDKFTDRLQPEDFHTPAKYSFEEVSSAAPMQIGRDTIKQGAGDKRFAIKDEKGKTVAEAIAWIGRDGTVTINGINSMGGANQLGAKAIREMAASFKQQFPHVTEFVGSRTSGARAEGGFQRVPAPESKNGGMESVAALKRGLESYKRGARSEGLQESLEQAKTRAQVWDFGGKDQAIRSELRKITNSPNRLRTYSPSEQALLKRIVGGNDAGRAMSSLGRFSPTRVIPALAGAAVGTNKPLYAIIGGAITGGAQVGGYLSTKRKVRELDELFRSGKVSPKTRDNLVRALLSAESGSASSGAR